MAKRPLSPAELKSFRHKVAQLKKKGLVSKTDARSAQPTWIRQGTRLDKLVAKYDDVLSGKAAAVKVKPAQLKQYKKAGFETLKGRVIIPHAAGERATVTPQGSIKVEKSLKPTKGIRRVVLPIPFHNLDQFVRDGKAQGEALNALKGGNRYWGYKFYGNNSYATYTDLDLLFDELSIGTASGLNLMDKYQESDRKQQNEIYQNLAFFSVPSQSEWPIRDFSKRSRSSAAARARYRKRIKGTLMGERERIRNKERQQKFRDKLKGLNLVEYKKKAKRRSKKSRKSNIVGAKKRR
jgi:hypothetical protein